MRVFLVILGALSMLLGFGCAVSGFGTFRVVDSDGYISSGPGELTTTAAAIVAQTSEIEDRSDDPGFREGKVRVRIRAARSDGGEVFIGIASAEAVEAYLRGSPYEVVREIEFDPLAYEGDIVPGGRVPGSPAEAVDWVASASGRGEQELDWQVRSGSHAFVIMNADGSAGVTVEANLAVKLPYVRGFGVALMVAGVLLLTAGLLLIALPLRGRRSPPSAGGEDRQPDVTGT
ncbi:MAG: hypothetical protein FIB00_16335 [Chloroflexi bacterium]|nr:hypothetical protein [Chloroflexota bacterium]PWB41458.1 MAG: hypothetical protein C3F10_15525 [Dehalococcoidia bacterium]